MPNKFRAIILLVIVAALAIYFYAAKRGKNSYTQANSIFQIGGRPLPDISTAQKRVNSYEPDKGDFKYRIVPKPVITTDQTADWNLYTSTEYGFSFSFPQTLKILDNTESLGYQLPPNQAFKGSRDNFQIIMQGKNNSYFLLFLNTPNAQVVSNKATATSTLTISGIKTLKQIFSNTDPAFSSSEVITYNQQQGNHNYLWYGAFDAKDFESINDFESMVTSMKFK